VNVAIRIGMLVASVMLGAEACRRVDPIATHPRVVQNVQTLVAWTLQARLPDGRFAGTEEAVPAGEPWRQPGRIAGARVWNLVPAADGFFHEQYEVLVDPTGVKGPHLYTFPPGGVGQRDADSIRPPTRWCQVRAVGEFGRGTELWEIGAKIVAEGDQVTQEPVTARPLSR
jgi:hypothetical protein